MSSIGSIYTDFTLKAAYCFDNKSFEYQHFCGLVFDSKLELMKKEIVKYLILTPKEKVPGCWFIQGKKEKEGPDPDAEGAAELRMLRRVLRPGGQVRASGRAVRLLPQAPYGVAVA